MKSWSFSAKFDHPKCKILYSKSKVAEKAGMDFRAKAFLQTLISLLPEPISLRVYYKVQRSIGNLRSVNPMPAIAAGKKFVDIGSSINFSFQGKKVIEVGSGRSPILPLSLWLQGASHVVTCDINPYFEEEIWIESIDWLAQNEGLIKKLSPLMQIERIKYICSSELLRKKGNILKGLHEIGIDYLAPADACMLPFSENYFDAHISYTVLEHIPRNIIYSIFNEAKRLVRRNGVIIHNIDYTDHFSHSDSSISVVNFLKFSEKKFSRLAGNRFMYMNRLRDDDFLVLWSELGLVPSYDEKCISSDVMALLEHSSYEHLLNEKFRGKNAEVLSTTEAWYGFKC